jgi:hypothetical protein
MTQTVDALKALYVALGGSAEDVADVNLIPDMIIAIATVAATATASELPKVTASDNGKVLKVAEGKWAVGTDEIQA